MFTSTARQKIDFFQQLATLLDAGLSPQQSVSLAAPAGNPQFQQAMQTASQSIAQGEALAAAFARYPRYFDDWTLSLIRLAEYSGALPEVCRRISRYTEQQQARQKLYRSALLSLLLSLVCVLLLGNLLLQGNVAFWILLIFILGSLFWLMQALVSRRLDRATYRLLSRVPLLGQLLRVRSVLYFTELALPLGCGVPILTAVELVRDRIPDPVLATALASATRQIRAGASLSQSLKNHLPPIAQQMLQTGEATGNIDGMLSKLAEYYDSELKKILGQLAAILRIAGLLAFGGLVLLLGIQMLQSLANRLPE